MIKARALRVQHVKGLLCSRLLLDSPSSKPGTDDDDCTSCAANGYCENHGDSPLPQGHANNKSCACGGGGGRLSGMVLPLPVPCVYYDQGFLSTGDAAWLPDCVAQYTAATAVNRWFCKRGFK